MHINLPAGYLESAKGKKPAWRLNVFFGLILALLCGWQLLGQQADLPGTLLKKYDPPADMPWQGLGLGHVFVEPDGTWTIRRKGYADRMDNYVIDPEGGLTKTEDAEVYFDGEDVSGAPHGGRRSCETVTWSKSRPLRFTAAFCVK